MVIGICAPKNALSDFHPVQMYRFYGEHSDSPVYLNLFVQFLQHIAALYSNFYRTIEMHAKKMRITFYYCIRFKSTIIFIFAKPIIFIFAKPK